MTAELKNAFSALTEEQQALVLAAYSFELTILAREGYEVGTEGLSDPALVRRINEVQHRVSVAVVSRLKNRAERYPDEVLIDIIAGGEDQLGTHLRSAFRRAWRTAFETEIGESLPE